MQKHFKSIFLCFALTFFLSTMAFAQNNVTVLENGLRVLVIEDTRFPLVSVRLYVHAGGSYEEPSQAGISHLLEHMVFRGTKKRPDGALAQEIESVGGDFNAYTSADETVYYTDLPAKEWRRGIDVVADMALNPIIDATILEEEKKVVYAEMGQRREEPNMRLYENTIALALDGTTYMHGVLGTEETVASISSADMKAYMDALYNPQNMLLVVVGDIKKDEVIKEARAQFMHKTNKMPQIYPSAYELPLFTGPKVMVEESSSNKVIMHISFPVPSIHDETSRVFDILQIVLGGLDTSILTQKFERKDNLVNTIGTYNSAYNRVSLFTISVDLEADKVKEFWQEFVIFMSQLSSADFTQSQLESAKFLYENIFQRRKGTISGYASLVGDSEFMSPGEFSMDNFLYAINQVSMEDLEEVIEEYFSPENMAVTVLAPKNAVDNQVLPNFTEVVDEYWQKDSAIIDIIADASYYKAYIPENAKIIEESEDRILIEYASGSKVILMQDTTMPFFVARLNLVGGNSLLNPNEQGLSSALASMSALATETMTRDELSEYLAERAISISSSNSRENFTFVLDSPSQFENEAFALFDEVIHKPAFNESDWQNIKNILLVNAKESEEEPGSLLFSELMPTLYTQSTAYGYHARGQSSDIENFTLEQVKNLWNKQKSQPWILTIVGDFRLDKALQFAQKLTINDTPIEPLRNPQMQKEKVKTFNLPDKNHEYIMQIFPTVPFTHEDAPALAVLDQVLGDMSGILFKEIREKRALAYQVAPIDFSGARTGFLAFYVNTALENGEKILPAFEEVIIDLQKNLIPQKDIDNAVLSMESAFIKAKQGLNARASNASNNLYLGRSLDYEEDFFKKAAQVTPKDIQRLANKYLNPENAYILTVTSE